MFKKAKIEVVLYSFVSTINKEKIDKADQFKNWNLKFYRKYHNFYLEKIKSYYEDLQLDSADQDQLATILLKRFLNRIPDNSLITRIIDDNQQSNEEVVICYPFFSSHVMLPVKPGEVVWVYDYLNEKKEKSQKSSLYLSDPQLKKMYWLSRVHGESFSEDLNFTHYDRSFMSTIIQDFEEFKVPDFFDYNDPENSPNIKTTSEIIDLEIQKQNFYLGPVLKTNKKPGDLVMQGSNNNSLIFSGESQNNGNISIVAGKGSNVQKIKNSNNNIHLLLDNEVFNNQNEKINSNYEIAIKNNLSKNSYYETLKYPSFYEENIVLDEQIENNSRIKSYEYKENNFSDDDVNYTYDASIFKIAEKARPEIKKSLFNMGFLDIQGKSFSNSSDFLFGPPQLFSQKISEKTTAPDSQITLQLSGSFSGSFNLDKPAIIAKSNDLFFISRKSSDLFKYPDGNIALIKDSEEYNSYAHLVLDNEGIISLDGHKIIIGTSKRNLDLNHGEGNLILLGESDKMEPIAKGEHLKSSMIHLISQIRQGFTLVANALDVLSTHKHATNYGNTLNVLQQSSLSEASNTLKKEDEGSIQNQLQDISDNLDKILSKLVRTS